MEHVSDIADDVANRLLKAHEIAASRTKDTKTPGKWQEYAFTLKESGFPLRHVTQLSENLFGPGLEIMQEHAPRIVSGDALLILVGDRGPGKTQIATCWAHERQKAGKAPGRYAKCADLIGDIKASWKSGGEQEILQKYRRTKYLVIDEFHEKGASDWEARTLINLIDHRYDDMTATVLIANCDPDKVGEIINPSIIDRANQAGGVIPCKWASYR